MARRHGAPGSLIRPVVGAGPVLVREGAALVLRSTPRVPAGAPGAVVGAATEAALWDLDFDVRGIFSREG